MDMVTIGTYLNAAQADLVAGRLEAAGFDVLRHGENSALTFDGGVLGVGGIRIQVPAPQAAEARALIAEIEAVAPAE